MVSPSLGIRRHKSTSEVGDARDASELPNTATCTCQMEREGPKSVKEMYAYLNSPDFYAFVFVRRRK